MNSISSSWFPPRSSCSGALAYNGEFADVIAFIADGRLDIAPLVTGRIGLEEIVERGFEELVNNKEHNVKIIVSPGG